MVAGRAMNDTAELILVDGPGAGQRVRFNSDWASSYILTSWPDLGRMVRDFSSIDTMTFDVPDRTVYRVRRVYDRDMQPLHVGWSSGRPHPDPEKVEYWVRFEPPIQVIAGTDDWPVGCDFGISENRISATIQGTCQCGWKTEEVPRRRMREMVELVRAHQKIGTFLMHGRNVDALGLDVGLLGRYSIGEATRYEALLSRAATIGMSRERAQAIFDEAQLVAYGFDDAIGCLQHRVRLFEMYGYEPLSVGDVLPWRDIRAQQIDPEVILNRPRWMPDPLGRQFAEMGRDRQRTLVEAAIELTAQLDDVGGWPLERAMAAVMPQAEESRR